MIACNSRNYDLVDNFDFLGWHLDLWHLYWCELMGNNFRIANFLQSRQKFGKRCLRKGYRQLFTLRQHLHKVCMHFITRLEAHLHDELLNKQELLNSDLWELEIHTAHPK